MRTRELERVLAADDDGWLSTGEAAALMSASRQHIVDLCERGDLPFMTTGEHRRVRRADVEALRSRTQRLTRDQRRSLWLGHAVAGRLVADPERVMSLARNNLLRLQQAHPRGGAARRLAEWERILRGPLSGVLDALTTRSPRARELRQNTPFAGVLSEDERLAVLAGFDVAEGKSKP